MKNNLKGDRRSFLNALLRRWCALLILMPAQAWPASVNVDSCFNSYESDMRTLWNSLSEKYGPSWRTANLPTDISSELSALGPAKQDIESDHSSLMDSRFDLNLRQRDLDDKTENHTARQSSLDRRYDDWNTRYRNQLSASKDLDVRISVHNARRCSEEENENKCDYYENEKRALEEEQAQLNREADVLNNEHSQLLSEQQSLSSENSELAELRNVVENNAATLSSKASAFNSRCNDVAARVQALIEVLGNQPIANPRQDEVREASAINTLTNQVGGELFSNIVPGGGAVLTAADVANADMDQHATEVTRNTYLLGEYAAALKRLKTEQRLRPGDPGYDALVEMTRKVGGSMPTSEAGFTWQSIANIRSVVNGAIIVAASYTGEATEHMSGDVLKGIDPTVVRALGERGAALVGVVVQKASKYGAEDVSEKVFEDGAKAIQEQSDKASQVEP